MDANDLQLAPKIKHIMVGGKSVKVIIFPLLVVLLCMPNQFSIMTPLMCRALSSHRT